MVDPLTAEDVAAVAETLRICRIIEREQEECRKAGDGGGLGACVRLLYEIRAGRRLGEAS